jgi:hypothetical protein
MKRLSPIAIAIVVLAAGCSSSTTPTTTAPTKPTFTADLRPANEVPPITNAESTGSGTATVTFDVTRDSANNITSSSVTFVANLSGFPPNTPINVAHIHEGASGVSGSIRVATTLGAGQVVLANGSGSFTSVATGVDAALTQAILNNPAGYYFNIHSTLNPGGVARGQLVRVN